MELPEARNSDEAPKWTPIVREKLEPLDSWFTKLEPYPVKLGAKNQPKIKYCGQKFLWTFANHLDKKLLLQFFQTKFSEVTNSPFKFFRVAHENGEGNPLDPYPYKHTHILVDFGKQIDLTRPADWLDVWCPGYIPKTAGARRDYIHGSLSNVGSAKHWKNAVQYLTKEDPENLDLRDPFVPNMAEGIRACPSDAEAIKKYYKRPGDARKIVEDRNVMNKPEDEAWITVDGLTMPWMIQFIELMDRVIEPPSIMPLLPREEWGKTKIGHLVKRHSSGKIDWIVSPGGQGKNTVATALVTLDPRKYRMCDHIPARDNLAQKCKLWRADGWSGHTVIFCLSRNDVDHKIYGPLEAIRDNGADGDKYEGFSGHWKGHNVVVMANWLPNLRALTLDKWSLWRIDAEYLTLETVTLDSALKAYDEQQRLSTKAVSDAIHRGNYASNNYQYLPKGSVVDYPTASPLQAALPEGFWGHHPETGKWVEK